MLLKLFLLIFVSAAALVWAKDEAGDGVKDIVSIFNAAKVEADTSAQSMTGVGTLAEKLAAYWKQKPLAKAENIMLSNAEAVQSIIDVLQDHDDKFSDEDQEKICNAQREMLKGQNDMLDAIISKDTVLQKIPNRLNFQADLKEVWSKLNRLAVVLQSKAGKCKDDVTKADEAMDDLMLKAIGALIGKHVGKLDEE
ncbi:hypothetical protein BGZ63DRAFT_391860 [Mariannaea sp. PMI_226]|nr:hypothetical protein BGZ63DRAFT_391860 [Mariannaea sp. PMI_226]